MPSLARNASARLAADLSTFVFGAVIAVVTARLLGPSGRGIVTALTFVAGMFSAIAVLGLNDAAVVMVGRKRVSMPDALSANIGFAAVSGAAAGAVCLLVADLLVQPDSTNLWLAVGLTAVTVPLGTMQSVLAGGLMMGERIVDASIVIAAASFVTAVATCIFVIPLSLDVLGAVIAVGCGGFFGLLLTSIFLRTQFTLRPAWDRSYLQPAARYGARVQISHLITLLAGRLDLLIAFSILGEAAAGRYSIGLTVAQIVTLAPFALAYATFPRLAYLTAPEAMELTLLAWRRSVIAALMVALALAALCPIGIPLLFGAEFSSSVTPTLILLVGAFFASGQWTLARAVAARGEPQLLFRSFGISLVLMVALDFALMPPFGLVGAALASTASNLAGIAMCLTHYKREEGVRPARLVPRAGDVPALLRDSARLFRGLVSVGRMGRPPDSM